LVRGEDPEAERFFAFAQPGELANVSYNLSLQNKNIGRLRGHGPLCPLGFVSVEKDGVAWFSSWKSSRFVVASTANYWSHTHRIMSMQHYVV